MPIIGSLSSERLVRVIRMQSEIARFGLDLGGVMQYVVDHLSALVEADGAAIENKHALTIEALENAEALLFDLPAAG